MAEWQQVVAQITGDVGGLNALVDKAVAARDETEAVVTSGLAWSGAVDLASVAIGPVYLRATLSGNTTITLPTPDPTRAFTVSLDVSQDATGGWTLTILGAKASYGVKPVVTATPGGRDILHLLATGTDWVVVVGAANVGVVS